MTLNPVYFDIMNYLGANGFGTPGDDIFGGEWGAPNKQVLVIDGVGATSEIKELYENPGFQILARGEKRGSDFDVYKIAKAISDFLLLTADSVEIDGTGYTGFEESSNIAPLGKDDSERFIYSMNFTTYRNRT